jgi:hypothetical protein
LYIVAAADPAGADPAADAAAEAAALVALGAGVEPPLVHAVMRIAMLAIPATHRARVDALIIRSPPVRTTRRSGRVDELPSPDVTGSRSIASMGGTSCA